VQLLEPLEPRDTMTSGFRVHAYLAGITPPPRWRIAEGEIAGVLTPTVRTLADPAVRHKRELSFATWSSSRWVECVVLEQGELLCCPAYSPTSGRSSRERSDRVGG